MSNEWIAAAARHKAKKRRDSATGAHADRRAEMGATKSAGSESAARQGDVAKVVCQEEHRQRRRDHQMNKAPAPIEDRAGVPMR
jgi:hypothetical protein